MLHSKAVGYQAMRQRVLDIADTLEPHQVWQPVPCCPAWTVHALLSHLAGVPADILVGNLDGVTTDAWTQAQVDARAEIPTVDVVAELREKGAVLDSLLADAADAFPAPFFIDAWTHEWDLRQALDRPAVPDLRMLDGPFDDLVAGATRRLDEGGHPPITLVADGEVHHIGTSQAEPRVLTTTRFEFMRLSLGRRSLRQIAALDWSGPATSTGGTSGMEIVGVESLIVFAPSAVDIVDPVRESALSPSAPARSVEVSREADHA